MKPRPPITSTRSPANRSRRLLLARRTRQCRCASDSNRSSDSIANPARSSIARPAVRRRRARRPSGASRSGRPSGPGVNGMRASARVVWPSPRDRRRSGWTVVNAKRPPGFSQRCTRCDQRRRRAARARRGRRSSRRGRTARCRTSCVSRSPCTSVTVPRVMRSSCSGCRASASIAADASRPTSERTPSSAQK